MCEDNVLLVKRAAGRGSHIRICDPGEGIGCLLSPLSVVSLRWPFRPRDCWSRDPGLRLRLPWARVKPPLRGFDVIFKRTLWNAVTRTALCAGRGTAFARRPATTLMLKKRCRAEYRLPPQSRSICQTCAMLERVEQKTSRRSSRPSLRGEKPSSAFTLKIASHCVVAIRAVERSPAG